MKTKRLISLLLLAVYLLAAGGPAWASLSCKCVAAKLRTAHTCCCHCAHESDAPSAKADVSAPCCSHHHSTRVDLYTGGTSDNERSLRIAATDLTALAPDVPDTVDAPSDCLRIVLRQTPLPGTSRPCGRGLRAPPALV